MAHNASHPPDGLPSYLGRLTQAPLLTLEEEQALTRRAREGDVLARQKLVESNMRLVINIARTYHSRAVPLEDLIQEGAIGLIQAIQRFDPDKGFRFSTYATHWVRQAIGRAIDNKAKAIRLPAHIVQTLRKVERVKAEMTDDLGREPSLDILARECGLDPLRLQAMMASAQEVLSLDMKVGEAENSTLGSLLRAGGSADPEGRMMHSEFLEELGEIVQSLDEREKQILALRLTGLAGQAGSLEGQDQISRDRRRQIEAQAVRKLRALAAARRLREFLSSD